MKKPVVVAISVLALAVGFAAGRLWGGIGNARAVEWEEQRRAVNSFYAGVPGFAEHLKTMQPMLDQVQDEAIRSIRKPPRTDREKVAYLTVVTLFMASRDFTPNEQAEAEVAHRAWEKAMERHDGSGGVAQ